MKQKASTRDFYIAETNRAIARGDDGLVAELTADRDHPSEPGAVEHSRLQQLVRGIDSWTLVAFNARRG